MATLHHNITGELTQELLAAGDDVIVRSISLANVHGTNAVSIDLFIQKSLTGRFYFFKQLSLPADTSYIYNTSFKNGENEFGLYIKLTKSASETPAVDVIIS
tara:strand:- start:1225 stop:1530 length:306 start_codon:yes stop_codon:yes gene_type:complete